MALQMRQQKLAASCKRHYLIAFEPRSETRWERKAQVLPPQIDAPEARAGQHWLEPTAHSLDFGKLGHVR